MWARWLLTFRVLTSSSTCFAFCLRDADALNVSQLHSFRELMRDEAESDLIADGWHWEAFEELELLGHLDPASHRALGGDAYGRLSADGREHLRTIDNHS